MTLGRPLAPLELTESDREQLASMARSRSLPHGLVRRAEIVLLAAEGWPNEALAAMVGVTRATVGKWRQRFLKSGLSGLHDERRPGAPRSIKDEQVAEVVYKTLKTKPEDETQWSVRSMGAETGLSKDAVHRIWRTFGLQPHRQNHFKLSTDPFFVDKVRDIVGLYMNPPEHAVVLCVDEKSQIQALELLPLGLGYVEGVTHDYKRHGTTTLFAALDTATGEVMTQCKPRHSSSFCAISRTTCPVTSTFISSSTTTARTSMTRSKNGWHGDLDFTFITRPPMLHGSIRWRSGSTSLPVRRSGATRFAKLKSGSNAKWNANAHPFMWTATADSILAKGKRLCEYISAT